MFLYLKIILNSSKTDHYYVLMHALTNATVKHNEWLDYRIVYHYLHVDYTFAYTPVYCVLQLDPNFELSPPS
jgi:hypothetical protein